MADAEFYLEHRSYRGGFNLHGVVRVDGGVRYFERSALGQTVQDYLMAPDPFVTLSQDQAQEIFNQLWQAGLRPKDGTGNSGHVAALQYHLEDMRKLVFKGE